MQIINTIDSKQLGIKFDHFDSSIITMDQLIAEYIQHHKHHLNQISPGIIN
jgi:hypothetical protein